MKQEEVSKTVRTIFIGHFGIKPYEFSWNTPLEELHKDFKILSYLMFLEQLIRQEFGEKVGILEEISTAFHTPKDLVELIMRDQ